MPVFYEWDIETVDEHGDVLDHYHSDKCPGVPTELGLRLVLVRDVYDARPWLSSRQWAYAKDGKLPECFDEFTGGDGAKVPQRFHNELAKSVQEVGHA